MYVNVDEDHLNHMIHTYCEEMAIIICVIWGIGKSGPLFQVLPPLPPII